MTIEFDGNFSGEDFSSLRKAMFKPYLKPARLIGQAVIIYIVVLFIITTAIENLTYDDCGCGTEAGQLKLAAVFALVFSMVKIAIVWSSLGHYWDNHCNSLVGVDLKTHYRMDEAGFASQSAETSFNLPWRRFASYFRTGRVYCLKSKSGMLHLIPTSELAEQDKEAILTLFADQGIVEQSGA